MGDEAVAEEVNTGVPPPAPGTGIRVVVSGTSVAVFNVGGVLHAIDDTCGHKQEPLDQGLLDGDCVTCRKHLAKYDLNTGHLVGGNPFVRRASHDIGVHQVRQESGKMFVRL